MLHMPVSMPEKYNLFQQLLVFLRNSDVSGWWLCEALTVTVYKYQMMFSAFPLTDKYFKAKVNHDSDNDRLELATNLT